MRSYKRKETEMGCQILQKNMKMEQDQELEEALFIWLRQKEKRNYLMACNLVRLLACLAM